MNKSTFVAVAAILVSICVHGVAHAQTTKAPPAYVVIEFTIKDPDGFKDYSQRAPATVTQYEGKFVVRGGKLANMKGDAPKGPYVVLQFENTEQAQKWAASPEYTALVPLRDKTADTRAFIVEGASP